MKLVVSRGPSQGKEFSIEEGSNLVGRWDPDSGSFPEVDLEKDDIDAKVSRKHAVIERAGEKVTIEDIGSMNGTFINRGPRLERGVKYDLKEGDELIVGKIFFQVVAK
ncbi:MAG: FHA domain-containing protein [Oligoflexia bacterium]|nr:FHA domain-containing protein [Oligoflexia bacterium]